MVLAVRSEERQILCLSSCDCDSLHRCIIRYIHWICTRGHRSPSIYSTDHGCKEPCSPSSDAADCMGRRRPMPWHEAGGTPGLHTAAWLEGSLAVAKNTKEMCLCQGKKTKGISGKRLPSILSICTLNKTQFKYCFYFLFSSQKQNNCTW